MSVLNGSKSMITKGLACSSRSRCASFTCRHATTAAATRTTNVSADHALAPHCHGHKAQINMLLTVTIGPDASATARTADGRSIATVRERALVILSRDGWPREAHRASKARVG